MYCVVYVVITSNFILNISSVSVAFKSLARREGQQFMFSGHMDIRTNGHAEQLENRNSFFPFFDVSTSHTDSFRDNSFFHLHRNYKYTRNVKCLINILILFRSFVSNKNHKSMFIQARGSFL